MGGGGTPFFLMSLLHDVSAPSVPPRLGWLKANSRDRLLAQMVFPLAPYTLLVDSLPSLMFFGGGILMVVCACRVHGCP